MVWNQSATKARAFNNDAGKSYYKAENTECSMKIRASPSLSKAPKQMHTIAICSKESLEWRARKRTRTIFGRFVLTPMAPLSHIKQNKQFCCNFARHSNSFISTMNSELFCQYSSAAVGSSRLFGFVANGF